jgi:hypothetical protein
MRWCINVAGLFEIKKDYTSKRTANGDPLVRERAALYVRIRTQSRGSKCIVL